MQLTYKPPTTQDNFWLLIDTIMTLFIYKKMMYSVESNRLPDLQKKKCVNEIEFNAKEMF
jgi:hypothetical protein